MMIPNENHEDSIKFYVAQLNDLKGRSEQSAGNKITDASLKNAVEVYNENRRLVKRLYESRKADNPPFAGSDIYEVMKAYIQLKKLDKIFLLSNTYKTE